MKTKRELDLTNDVVLSPVEVAELMGISLRTTYDYLRKGIIPGRMIGRRWFVVKSALMKLISGEEL